MECANVAAFTFVRWQIRSCLLCKFEYSILLMEKTIDLNREKKAVVNIASFESFIPFISWRKFQIQILQQLRLQPRSQGTLSSSLEKVLFRGRKREDPGNEVATTDVAIGEFTTSTSVGALRGLNSSCIVVAVSCCVSYRSKYFASNSSGIWPVFHTSSQ